MTNKELKEFIYNSIYFVDGKIIGLCECSCKFAVSENMERQFDDFVDEYFNDNNKAFFLASTTFSKEQNKLNRQMVLLFVYEMLLDSNKHKKWL